MSPRRRVAAAAVLVSTALAGAPALASPAPVAGSDDRPVARAADRYGVSEGALRHRMQGDPGFRITPSGVALSIDPAPKGPPSPSMVAKAFPLEDTFKLHSKPGSQRTIYLDFDGATVSNTIWNTDFDGPANPGVPVPAGNHPAMDLAGNGPAFSNSEKLQIQDIFQRVAEDYAPFDVDVTTEEPPAAALDRANAGDQVYGTRAVISPSTSAASAICQSQCGGVAFIGVFNHYAGKGNDATGHQQYQPAWIFPQMLTQGNLVKNIAEATTHEVGHNLGLDHDGTSTLGYYAGHNGWAPIMGVGYSQPIVQLALSDYPGAKLGGPGPGSAQSNPDDVATIAAFGAPQRADEPGTSIGNAGPVPTGSAYISSRTDVDYYALGTCAGSVSVAANNAPVSPNLDIEVQLLRADGTTVAVDDPVSSAATLDVANGMDATATGTGLPPGQYFARIDGVGRGTATTGYTDYGSLGAYTLQVTGCSPATKPRKPRIGKASPGKRGGRLSAKVAWRPPSGTTSPAVDGYRAVAYRQNKKGRYVKVSTSPVQGAKVRSIEFSTNVRARLKFAVQAHNALGWGPLSKRSNAVRPR